MSIPAPGEQLRYNISWPSGLTLGEATLRFNHAPDTAKTPGKIDIEFTVDASIPGFQVLDRYHSVETSGSCSVLFDKKYAHGSRKAEEVTKFDQEHQTATRETANSDGKTDLTTPACAKDALAFFYFLRGELAQGRLPQQQKVFFGALYDVRLQFRDTQTVKVLNKSVQAERVTVTVRGPASNNSFDVLFAKDAIRTPVLIRVPLAMGTFSAELVR